MNVYKAMLREVVLCLLLLALTQAAKGQRRRKTGIRSNNRLLRDGGNDLPCQFEVAFILDSSEGAKTFLFEKQKTFVLRFSTRLSELHVAGWTLRVRMAALQYSNSVSIDHSFSDWQDLDVFHSKVSAMTYIGHGTYSSYAITNATQLFMKETPVDSIRVAVLITDGADHPRNPDVVGVAAEAKGHGIRLFAIALSDIARQSQNSAKLRAIASTPPQQFVQRLTDRQLEDKLLKEMAAVALEECPQAKTCLCEKGERGLSGIPGKKGDQGFDGSPGTKGSKGEPGVSGRPGSEGLEGRTGYKGDKGERGDCGTPGIKGDAGPEGPAGLRGSRGEQGASGPPGERGPEGLAGPKGDQGAPGASGPPGDTGIGFPGPKGDRGIQGRAGPAGPIGIGEPGLPGPPGPAGALGNHGQPGEGIPGQKGDRGYDGPRGNRGPSGIGVKGDKGSQGQPGPIGPVGAVGVGIQGEKGNQGPTGPTGPRGTPGIGLIGQKGNQGFSGEPGIPGERGVGEPGPKGDPGAEGVLGLPGLPGEDGAPAQKGDVGLPGPRGPDGTPGKGVPGEKGDRGDRGSRGQPGTLGPVGPIGPKGEPGITGASGASGPPGRGKPGAKGDPGPAGNTGPVGEPGIGNAGPKGDRGLPGPVGSAGLKGEGHPGPPGPTGPSGLPGDIGPEGNGLPGSKGDRGLPGPAGPAGAPGIGLIGPKGSTGQKGAQGSQGLPGEGIQGQKGETGFQGIPGPRGPPGLGLQGDKGDRGITGERGTKGEKGETGEGGTPGPVGRLGQKGEAGLSREEIISIVQSICGCGVKCRQTPLELVFVIDSSESVGPDNFKVVKDFVNALIDRASVSQETTRVGVVLYSHINMVVAHLYQQLTRERIKAAVRSMTYLGEGTFTASAIQQATREFQAARAGVRKVAVVITDGQADKRDTVRLDEAVKEAHGSNVEMFVIGVVNKSDPLYEEFRKELYLMASQPDEEHVFLIEDFRTLSALENKLLSRICESVDGTLFSQVSSSRLSPGVTGNVRETPGAAGIVRESPDRIDTDTPTYTEDYKRKQLGPEGSTLGPIFIPQSPTAEDRSPPETFRVPSFDREPFKPLTPEFVRLSEVNNAMAGIFGPEGPTSASPITERTTPSSTTASSLAPDAFLPEELCRQILDPGPCREYVMKWYYDATANACAQFWFGGCRGNSNQFETERECTKTCVRG